MKIKNFKSGRLVFFIFLIAALLVIKIDIYSFSSSQLRWLNPKSIRRIRGAYEESPPVSKANYEGALNNIIKFDIKHRTFSTWPCTEEPITSEYKIILK